MTPAEIFNRLLPVFKKNIEIENRSPIWKWCHEHSSKVEMTQENLENMANNDLVWGFFGGSNVEFTRNTILLLAQAVGAIQIDNPERDVRLDFAYQNSDLLRMIESELGFKINFPSFVGNRKTVMTDCGIITERHCYYLWILKRIIELCPDRNSAILEIGAGMGLLGYYLDKAGYKDYTTIDLANAGACQTYFLARNLPERELILSGEWLNATNYYYNNDIKLLHSTDFHDVPQGRFDLMVNMDGLTEMNKEDAIKYVSSDCAPLLLSVNHEINAFRVFDICKPYRKLVYRYPFWTRPGYVEELYKLK